ncbi:MAG: DUF2892 domain-containing protein [Hyphomicrobiaceae bacterium]
MDTNIGNLDRIVRVIVGLALIALAAGYWPGAAAQPWAWIGLVPLLTALVGWCPAYRLLGVSTCKRSV